MAEEVKKSSKKKKIIIAVVILLIIILIVYFVWFRKSKPTCDAAVMAAVKAAQSDRGKWNDTYDYGSAGGGTMGYVKPLITKTGITDELLVEYTKAFMIGYDVKFDGWTPNLLKQYIAAWINSGNAVEPGSVKLGEYLC